MVSAASVIGTLLVVRDMRQRAEGPLYPVSLSRSATVLPRANQNHGDTHQGDEHADDHDVHRDPLSAALDLRRSYGKWLPMGNKAALTGLRSPAQYGAADPKPIPAREGGHHGPSRDSCRAPRRTRSGLHARDQRQSLASPVHGRAYRPRD